MNCLDLIKSIHPIRQSDQQTGTYITPKEMCEYNCHVWHHSSCLQWLNTNVFFIYIVGQQCLSRPRPTTNHTGTFSASSRNILGGLVILQISNFYFITNQTPPDLEHLYSTTEWCKCRFSGPHDVKVTAQLRELRHLAPRLWLHTLGWQEQTTFLRPDNLQSQSALLSILNISL